MRRYHGAFGLFGSRLRRRGPDATGSRCPDKYTRAVTATESATPVALRLIGLTKRFGDLTAVDRLDLELRRGEVLGFLGPNGSGKSTTVGMILGLIAPSAGRVEYTKLSRRRIGAVVEEPAFYPYLSGRDNLRALALAFGGAADGEIDSLLEMVGLSASAGRRYRTYSTGMKQRLGIASTMLGDPELIILDEPTNGLDPAGQREIRELIPRLAHEGRSVMMASHLLHEVEHVCERVAIVRHGRLLREGTVSELLGSSRFLEVEIAEPAQAAAIIGALPFVASVELHGSTLRVDVPEDRAAEIGRALGESGLYPTAIAPRQQSLEDVFLELTASQGAPAAQKAAGER